MGRAPTTAVPQRVSARGPVPPDAPSFATDDEDDKTMIESGWEDEPSTTVEQGDVAEKLRSLGLAGEAAKRPNSSTTSPNAGVNPTSEEQTVDDQRASAAVALLPPPLTAQLVITQGNDAGQSLEITAGRTYTIGRGVDNDLVLTDLAVSRKHFDLRNDNGAWMLADRGSGNGTLVNARLEDAPFVLAHGDVIEIGNTAFRFDLPSGVPRTPPNYEDSDDLDVSTVSGAPLRDPDTPVSPPASLEAMTGAPAAATGRPAATARPATNRPLPGLPAPPPDPAAPAANRTSPLARSGLAVPAPGAVSTHLQTTMPLMQSRSSSAPGITLRGQGPAILPSHPARLPFAYTATEPVSPQLQHAVGARGSVSVPQADPTSTALVEPISYSNRSLTPAPPEPPATSPSRAPTARRRIAVVGSIMFAVIAVIALTRGDSGPPVPVEIPITSTPTFEPIAPSNEFDRSPEPPLPTASEPRRPVPGAAATPPTVATTPPPTPSRTPTLATTLPPVAATPPTPPKPPTRVAPAPSAFTATARPTPTPPATKSPVAAAAAPTPPVRSEAPASRPDPRKPVKRPDNKRLERKTGRDADEPEAAAPRKRAGRSIQDVRAEAAIPYRAKNFAAAAAAVNAALPSFTGAEVQELKGLAANYSQFGKSYNVGTAPGTKATEAFALLTKARSIDRDFLGGIYVPEIEQKLIGIGTRAAATFMVSKNYEEAFQAVHTSESLGGKSSTNKSVRDSLDEAAADLLREASAALASDPGTARAKARQAQALVEPKTPLYLRAAKLINGS